MEIKRVGSQPSTRGPSEWFTGTVRIDPLFQAPDPALVQGASVTFEPGARTAWHTHPLGQTLIITAGCGWVQREGGPTEEIHPGDVVWISPGEKHWHGAHANDGHDTHRHSGKKGRKSGRLNEEDQRGAIPQVKSGDDQLDHLSAHTPGILSRYLTEGGHMPARNDDLKGRLSRYREITITVNGRKSGRSISLPVWFVLEDDKLYLLPVKGSGTQWYKNVLKNPSIRIEARGAEAELQGVPITDAAQVAFVVEKFRAKYGDSDVKKYYSQFDVAVSAQMT